MVRSRAERAYLSVISLTSFVVLLQGLWAGIFLEHDGERDAADKWINVHARGAEIAIGLAALAAVIALIWLRRRVDLWLGAGVLAALLVAEAYIGGLIHNNGDDSLTAIHVPLAMGLMGMAVWLPVHAFHLGRARRRGAGVVEPEAGF